MITSTLRQIFTKHSNFKLSISYMNKLNKILPMNWFHLPHKKPLQTGGKLIKDSVLDLTLVLAYSQPILS